MEGNRVEGGTGLNQPVTVKSLLNEYTDNIPRSVKITLIDIEIGRRTTRYY